jgi:acylglycerol lipase
VLLLHGKGDHGGGFGPLAEELVARGWEVLAPDMRGFGRSGGIRCWIEHFSQYQADLEAIVEQVWPQPGILQVWCGYSAGANWATEYALAHPDQVQGLILISPAFRIDHYFNRFTWGLLQVLDKVLPQLALTGPYEPGAGDLPSGAAGGLGCRSLRVWCYPGPVYGGAGAQRPALP